VPGHYNRDHQAFIEYQQNSQSLEAFAAWQARWVDSVHSSADYLALLGEERAAGLRLKIHAWSEVVDYGY
jgi:hypothetical protein